MKSRRPQHIAANRQGDPARSSAVGARRRTIWLSAFFIAFLGCVAFANSFHGVFVYDDLQAIRDNPFITRLWPLSDAMSLPMIDGGETVSRRPLLSLSFALNRNLLGPEPWRYHLVNLAIHIAAGLLLFGLVRRTLLLDPLREHWARASTGVALAAALLWTVHPLQTESVTYIVQRAESLTGMLYLLTLYCSLRGFQSRWAEYWYLAAVLACAAGMAVKEVMVTAPVVVLLYDGTFVSDSYLSALRKRWQFYACLAATWAVVLSLQYFGRAGALEDFTERSPLAYALTQPGVILYYLRLSFVPHPLVMDWNWPTAETLWAIVPAGVVVVLLLGVTAWGVYRRTWYGFLGASFFLILSPSSSFVALNQNLEEHRMYLPLAAVLLLAIVAGYALLRRFVAAERLRAAEWIALVAVLLLAAPLIARTIARNHQYHSSKALWADNLRYRPNSANAHLNLGLVTMEEGKLDRALVHFQQVVKLEPHAGDGYVNLGVVLMKRGDLRREQNDEDGAKRDYVASLKHLRTAVELDPKNPDVQNNLGLVLSLLDKQEEAIRHLREAVRLDPNHVLAYFSLARILADQGEHDEAIRHVQQLLAFKPNDAGLNLWLADLFYDRGDNVRAAQCYEAVLRVESNDLHSHVQLGLIHIEQRSFSNAVRHFEYAVAIAPEDIFARFNLANALAGLGRLDAAVVEYRNALALNTKQPTSHAADIHCNLGITLFRQKRPAAAIEQFNDALEIDDRHLQAHVMLGMVYLDGNQPDAAIAHLEQALEIEPGSQQAQQMLRRAKSQSG